MWAAIVNICLGLWMMVSPALFAYPTEAANNSYIIGPLVVTFATTAVWEVNRNIRLVNIPLGLWLAAVVFLLDHSGTALYNNLITGIAIAALSFAKGTIKGRYGGGWRSLFT